MKSSSETFFLSNDAIDSKLKDEARDRTQNTRTDTRLHFHWNREWKIASTVRLRILQDPATISANFLVHRASGSAGSLRAYRCPSEQSRRICQPVVVVESSYSTSLPPTSPPTWVSSFLDIRGVRWSTRGCRRMNKKSNCCR